VSSLLCKSFSFVQPCRLSSLLPVSDSVTQRGIHKGAAALLWGEPAASMHASVFFAGRQRASGVGGTRPAPACPWGKRERGIEFLAAAGHFCHADAVARRATLESEDMAGWLFLAPGSLFVGSHYLASIRTIFRASF
jgi:hypothetical protein